MKIAFLISKTRLSGVPARIFALMAVLVITVSRFEAKKLNQSEIVNLVSRLCDDLRVTESLQIIDFTRHLLEMLTTGISTKLDMKC